MIRLRETVEVPRRVEEAFADTSDFASIEPPEPSLVTEALDRLGLTGLLRFTKLGYLSRRGSFAPLAVSLRGRPRERAEADGGGARGLRARRPARPGGEGARAGASRGKDRRGPRPPRGDHPAPAPCDGRGRLPTV